MVEAKIRLGDVLAAEQKFDEAMQLFDLLKLDVLKNQYVYENLFSRNPALMLSLVRMGRVEEATQRLTAICVKNREHFGENHYLTAEALGLRGMAHAKQEKEAEALKDFSEALPVLMEQSSSGTLSYDRKIRRRIILES
jgi:predicted negative regulator of RcsB-dependent stress response